MKLKYVPIALFLGAMSLLFSSYRDGYTNGSGGDNRTGSQGSVGCGGSGCHGAGATAGITVFIELDSLGVPVAGYHGGGSYTVKLSAINTTTNNLPNFGYCLSTVKSVGAGTASAVQAGNWGTMPSGSQISFLPSPSNILIAEHQVPLGRTGGTGTAGTTYSVSVPWTAPRAGTGSVAFYGVINAVDGDGNESLADKWNSATATVAEAGSNVGIHDLSDKVSDFSVYPTLMNSNVTIAFDLIQSSSVTAELISMNGQVVKTFLSGETLSGGAFKSAYDINDITTGVYFVRVQIGGSFVVSKVVKQ